MPLRSRLQLTDETLQDFELASEEHYWDGLSLLVSGHYGAGIYLLGYVAEMLLKNSYFYLRGARPYDLVAPRLAPARAALSSVHTESYHSLNFWAQLLQQERSNQGCSLLPPLDIQFSFHTSRLYGNWWIEMRYRPDQSTLQEAHEVLEDVEWIRNQYPILRSP